MVTAVSRFIEQVGSMIKEIPKHNNIPLITPSGFKELVQCSRASQPTFKNPHWELPELKNSVLCIPLTVLSEKEVI